MTWQERHARLVARHEHTDARVLAWTTSSMTERQTSAWGVAFRLADCTCSANDSSARWNHRGDCGKFKAAIAASAASCVSIDQEAAP